MASLVVPWRVWKSLEMRAWSTRKEHGADRLLREIGRQAEGKAPSSGSRVGSQKWPIPPAELRHRRATSLYETEMFFREEGLSDFVYDEENDLFRF